MTDHSFNKSPDMEAKLIKLYKAGLPYPAMVLEMKKAFPAKVFTDQGLALKIYNMRKEGVDLPRRVRGKHEKHAQPAASVASADPVQSTEPEGWQSMHKTSETYRLVKDGVAYVATVCREHGAIIGVQVATGAPLPHQIYVSMEAFEIIDDLLNTLKGKSDGP